MDSETVRDYERVGFGRSTEFGSQPALLVVDMCKAYFQEGSPLNLDRSDVADAVVSDWESRLFNDDLPEICTDWLARNCGSMLTDAHLQKIVSRLDTIHSRDNVPESEAKRYQKFVKEVSPDGLATDPMQAHLTNLFTQIGNRHANPNSYLYRIFPAVPTLLPHAPASAVGVMLHTLFSNTPSDPDLFGWLCHWMARHWPEKDGETGPYNPKTIFNQANAITQSHPSTKWSYGALQTMNQMVRLKRVDESKLGEVASATCRIWAYHPTNVLPIIKDGVIPTPEDTGSLIDAFTGDDALAAHLREAFLSISSGMSADQRRQTALLILQKPAKGTEVQPDFCLGAWIDGCSATEKSDVLETLLLADGLNDEQRKRVWLQIEAAHDELGNGLLISVMPRISAVNDVPTTVSEMLMFAKSVSSKITTADEKHSLGNSLVASMKATSSKDAKNKIAALLKSLEMDSMLESFEEPSEVDLEILKEHFGRTSAYKKLAKRIEQS